MTPPVPRFYFDAVDPLSFVAHTELTRLRAALPALERVPLELRPAPAELTDADDPFWSERWGAAAAAIEAGPEPGTTLRIPSLVPRSRKAHELFLHARGAGVGTDALERMQQAFLVEGRDIGRVDVLVEIGRGLGLDFTETKAVLDVDKYEPALVEAAERARLAGITPPCLEVDGRRLQGFHNQAAVRTFLAPT